MPRIDPLKATHCYIGQRPCGCIMAERLDTDDKGTAKDVDEMVAAGLEVKRIPLKKRPMAGGGHRCGLPNTWELTERAT